MCSPQVGEGFTGTMPMAYFPCPSSSKHHAVYMGNDCLDLITLCVCVCKKNSYLIFIKICLRLDDEKAVDHTGRGRRGVTKGAWVGVKTPWFKLGFKDCNVVCDGTPSKANFVSYPVCGKAGTKPLSPHTPKAVTYHAPAVM